MPNVSEQEYAKMTRSLKKLEALEAGGVDNWEFYGESLEGWRKECQFEEDVDTAIVDLHDILTEADVDYPAGREAGHSITIEDSLIKPFIIKLMTRDD